MALSPMLLRKVLILLYLILFTISLSCSSIETTSQLECIRIDWYEYGRKDGMAGAAWSKYETYIDECRKQNAMPDYTLYENGRNYGLTLYCTKTSGFESGRAGNSYEHVCPDLIEPTFLKAYELGQQVYQLEKENSNISQLIKNLSKNSDHFSSKEEFQKEIQRLRQQQSQNSSAIKTLESQIN